MDKSTVARTSPADVTFVKNPGAQGERKFSGIDACRLFDVATYLSDHGGVSALTGPDDAFTMVDGVADILGVLADRGGDRDIGSSGLWTLEQILRIAYARIVAGARTVPEVAPRDFEIVVKKSSDDRDPVA